MTQPKDVPPGDASAPTPDEAAAITYAEFARQGVTLTNCDREPIHIPGAIQPHGFLIVLEQSAGSDGDVAGWQITRISANCDAFTGRAPDAWLGRSADALLDDRTLAELARLAGRRLEEIGPQRLTTTQLRDGVGTAGRQFDAVAHRVRENGPLIVEFEPPPPELSQAKELEAYAIVRAAMRELEKAPDVQTLCNAAAEAVQQISGFDRVMFYRFDEHYNGQIIAESRVEQAPSYLGLHYPSSDIPRQARELYLRNRIRLIADLGYAPVPLVPPVGPDSEAPLDMSFCVLRSVSPIHVEYLTNMGVSASMSISITDTSGTRLWGLIACHHLSPRYVGYGVRTACELLGAVISMQLQAAEERELLNYRNRLSSVQAQLVGFMTQSENVIDGLIDREPNLLSFVHAGGAAIVDKTSVRTLGEVPAQGQIVKLAHWIAQRSAEDVFATDSLAELDEQWREIRETAAGVLAIPIAGDGSMMVLWFRPEAVQTVDWGGDPAKDAQLEPEGEGVRLSPRKSFEKWKQVVSDHCEPWTKTEHDAAGLLREAIIAIVLRRLDQLSRLNQELAASNRELGDFAYAASHDLKEPLRGIYNYSHFLIEDFGEALGPEGRERIGTLISLAERMERLISSLLHYSRVGRTELSFRPTDLQRVLEDVLVLLTARIEETGVEIKTPRPLPTVRCDRTRIGEVFNNLISNALKYNDSPEPRIEIGYEEDHPDLARDPMSGKKPIAFYVRDNGIGIDKKHHEAIFRIFRRLHPKTAYGGGSGAGLTIVKKVVERHRGKIWIDSEVGKGTTFWFTLESPG